MQFHLSFFFLLLFCQLCALWPLIVLRAVVLVACVENLIALEPQNAYNADERALDWLIFDRVSAVPFALAEAALRAACAQVEDDAKASAAQISAQISADAASLGMSGAASTTATIDPLALPLTGAGAVTMTAALAASAAASSSSSAAVHSASPSVELSAAAQHVAQWLDALPLAHSTLPPTPTTVLAV